MCVCVCWQGVREVTLRLTMSKFWGPCQLRAILVYGAQAPPKQECFLWNGLTILGLWESSSFCFPPVPAGELRLALSLHHPGWLLSWCCCIFSSAHLTSPVTWPSWEELLSSVWPEGGYPVHVYHVLLIWNSLRCCCVTCGWVCLSWNLLSQCQSVIDLCHIYPVPRFCFIFCKPETWLSLHS